MHGRRCFVVLLLLVTMGCAARGRVTRLQIDLTGPQVADNRDPLVVSVRALDGARRPVSGAEIRVALILGIDEIMTLTAVETGKGRYEARFTSQIAGLALVQAWDTKTGVSEKRIAGFIAGDAAQLDVSFGPPAGIGNELAYPIIATVDDNFTNPRRAPEADVVFTTDFGRLDPVTANPDGTFTTRIRADRPGVAQLVATDRVSGLTTRVEIIFPAIALMCRGAVHLTELEDREFPVDLWFFTGSVPLGGYDLLLELNERTSFVRAEGAGSRMPPPEARTESESRVRLIGRSAQTPPSGYFHAATLIFECEEEGDSVITVTDAVLSSTGGDTTAQRNDREIADQPRLAAVCPNKRVKCVCINPILVGRAMNRDVLNATLTAHFAEIQKNLDEGCCRILIQSEPLKELAPPASYQREVDRNTNRDRTDDVVQVEWDARSMGSTMEGEINLSPGMADLLCDRTQRKNECINLYVVPDRSLFGLFPSIDAAEEESRELAGKVVPEQSRFAGADIKRRRLKPDGSGCEDLKIYRGSGAGRTEIAAGDCQVNAVVMSPGNLGTHITLKHEIGHMLGLRHPWEYADAKLKEIIDSERASTGRHRSVMRYHGDRTIYSAEECRMITAQNCNEYQKDCPR